MNNKKKWWQYKNELEEKLKLLRKQKKEFDSIYYKFYKHENK